MIKKSVLICIFLLAIFLRFFQLSDVPPSLSWDEVAIGYNAWSILKTGKDEYGVSFPMLFRSFDDSKLPGMIYTTVVSEAIFGLNEFGVRFPSAFFGVLTVIVCYFILKELSNDRLAILGAFLFAINPWLINFSRQAFESNASLFFFSFGVLFLLKSLGKSKFIFLASVSIVISIYFYYSVRIVAPILLLVFIILYRDWAKNNLKKIILAGLLGLILLIPILKPIFSSGGFLRINQVAVTNDAGFIGKQEDYANLILGHSNSMWARFFYNRRVALVETITANYLKNLSLEFVFKNGVGTVGLLYFWELPFFIFGFYFLIKEKGKWKWMILTWFLASSLAAAFTKNQPNALRTLIGAPSFIIMSTFGIYYTFKAILEKVNKRIFVPIVSFIVILSLVQFSLLYFDYTPKVRSIDFGDGYKQLAEYLETTQDKYDIIWVTGSYWRPYIHLLFHMKYDPKKYQAGGSKDGFGKFHFGKAAWDTEGVDLESADIIKLVGRKKDEKKTALFILTKRELERKTYPQLKFTKVTPINGKYAKEVFWAMDFDDYLNYLDTVSKIPSTP